ncbi:MAG: HAD family hydrolase [Anaerolineales bacterium]
MSTQAEVVAVDLEGTLTAGETWRGIRAYQKANGGAWSAHWMMVRFAPAYARVKLGRLPRPIFNARWVTVQARYLRGMSAEAVHAMIDWVMDNETWPARRATVIAELDAHRAAGRRVVVVSGAYQPVVEAFGARINAVACFGTPMEWDAAGRLTGRLATSVNTHEHKVAALQNFLNGAPLVAAYGDTHADIPMLELAREPVAVHPDPELRAAAQARGWRILDD